MTNWYGMLGIGDSDRVFQATEGQQVVYTAATAYLAQINAQLMAQMQLLVSDTTETYKQRYRLPGGGRLQRRGVNSQPGATRASGYWDVAYPLDDFADQKAWNDVDRGYMTMAEFDIQLQDTILKNVGTVRYEMLKAIFNNTARTFSDRLWGDLTIQPLANGDAVLYPPIAGSETEAIETLYYGSNYTAANISDTNNPITGIVTKLEDHFGENQGGERIVVFVTLTGSLTEPIKAPSILKHCQMCRAASSVMWMAHTSANGAGCLLNICSAFTWMPPHH
jgi:hypothetical protein